jgi:hypothetical protein
MTSYKAMVLVSLLLLGVVPAGLANPSSQYNTSEPTVLLQFQDANFTQVSIAADAQANLHSVAVHDNGHLFYTLSDTSGEILVNLTQISDAGIHRISNPVIEIDTNDVAHVVWVDESGSHKIMYTALDVYDAILFSGESSSDAALSLINDTILVMRAQNRGNPDIALDSYNNIHLVWEDRYDELGLSMITSNIYYKLLHPNLPNRTLETVVDESIISVSKLESTHPQVVLSSSDVPTVLWQESSRDFGMEMTFVIDTSGSMYSEWADVCTIMYGGNFASGGYFQGLKPMFNASGISLYETLYGLGNTLPGAASSGNCQAYNQNAGPRSTPLGPGDDSGGIRKLPGTVYNSNTYSGYSGEDWGPGSNWACLSWKDAQGNVPGNPPTGDDHRWNPNATKFVIPVSDEGPKDGDPSQQADDLVSIQEAHDNCINAGVIPLGLYGQGYGGAGNIQSHFMDLVQCPNGVVSTQGRNCPATNLSNTDAGGIAWEFPQSTGTQWDLVIESIWGMFNSNAPKDLMLKTVDPYNRINNDLSWANGTKGHNISNGVYLEDLGGFVRVQNSAITNISGISYSMLDSLHEESFPQAKMDSQNRLHLSWLQSFTNITNGSATERLQYALVDAETNRVDGVPEGLLFNGSRILSQPQALSNNSSTPVGGAHALELSSTGDVHLAWKGHAVLGQNQIFYTKFDPDNTTSSLVTLTHQATNWTSGKLNQNSRVALATLPAVAYIAWDDMYNCGNTTLTNLSSICQMSFVEKGLNFEFDQEPSSPFEMYPSDTATFILKLDTNAFGTTSVTDESIWFQFPSLPASWDLQFQHPGNGSSVNNNSEILVPAGSTVYLDMTVKAPTLYTATASIQFDIPVYVEMVDFVHVNRTLLVSASLTVNSSVTASSNNASISIMQGGEETIPMSITSASNVMETAMISWSSPTPDFDSMFNVNAPMFEYLGPGDDVSRSLILQAKNETLPGNYSITVEVASAYINPLEVSSFSVSIEVRPQLKDNLIFNISSFDPYFRSNECRLVSLDLTKMYGPGDLWLDLSGAVDGRFVHGDEDWTFDFRSLAADNTEFRGPWSHEHRQRGEMITLELCSPSVMPSQHPVIFDIVPTWNGFDVSLNSQTITVYPYHESEWEIDGKSTQLMERTVNITGSLLNNSHSGRVIFEFALNSSVLDSSDLTKQTMSELDMYRAITLNEPGDFHVNLNLSFQLDEGVQGYTTVYVRVTDAKSANQLELVYQYNPMVDSDGDQIADSLDAFVNVASQWSDIDGDGYGDNWGNASWNQTRQQYEIGQFVFGAVMADYCPEIPGNSTANGFYGCPDDDGDGIPNLFDYEDEVLDADGDGIPDEIDECPYTPFGTLIDSLGCKLQTDTDGTMSRNEDSFLQGEIARTVGWGAILVAVFTFLQTNAAAAILPDTFRWVQVFRNNSKLTREEENELTYLQSLVQAYYLEPETLAEELREFKADLTARYTNNEVKKSTQEKISVLIKDILSSSEDDLAHIAHNEGYFGLVSTVALNERMDLLSEKLAMENDTPHNVFDELLPPQDVKGEINPENGFEWIEYPEGSKSWYLRSQSADPWKKWES